MTFAWLPWFMLELSAWRGSSHNARFMTWQLHDIKNIESQISSVLDSATCSPVRLRQYFTTDHLKGSLPKQLKMATPSKSWHYGFLQETRSGQKIHGLFITEFHCLGTTAPFHWNLRFVLSGADTVTVLEKLTNLAQQLAFFPPHSALALWFIHYSFFDTDSFFRSIPLDRCHLSSTLARALRTSCFDIRWMLRDWGMGVAVFELFFCLLENQSFQLVLRMERSIHWAGLLSLRNWSMTGWQWCLKIKGSQMAIRKPWNFLDGSLHHSFTHHSIWSHSWSSSPSSSCSCSGWVTKKCLTHVQSSVSEAGSSWIIVTAFNTCHIWHFTWIEFRFFHLRWIELTGWPHDLRWFSRWFDKAWNNKVLLNSSVVKVTEWSFNSPKNLDLKLDSRIASGQLAYLGPLQKIRKVMWKKICGTCVSVWDVSLAATCCDSWLVLFVVAIPIWPCPNLGWWQRHGKWTKRHGLVWRPWDLKT